jgi:hypothetical protein
MTRRRNPTFEKFRDYVLGAVHDVGNNFTDPKEDWHPVLLMDNVRRVIAVDLRDIFRTKQNKLILPQVLLGLFRSKKPILAGLVLSGWQVKVDPTDPLAGLAVHMIAEFGASTHPARTEVLMVELASQDGRAESWTNDILRYLDKPPVLGEWTKMDAAQGRFGEILRQTFAAVKAQHKPHRPKDG